MKFAGPWQVAADRFDDEFIRGIDLFWDAQLIVMLCTYQVCPGCKKIFPFAHINHVCYGFGASGVRRERDLELVRSEKPK